MSSNPQTDHVRFSVQQYAFVGGPQGIHVEMSTMTSLKDITTWLKKYSFPVVAHALISIEFPTDGFIDMTATENPSVHYLPSIAKPSVIALTEKLVDRSMDPHESDEIEELGFAIIKVDDNAGVVPGVFVEVAHGKDLVSEQDWRGNTLPVSVIGYVSIEVYRDTLPLNIRSTIAARNYGGPEALEELVRKNILDIITLLMKA